MGISPQKIILGVDAVALVVVNDIAEASGLRTFAGISTVAGVLGGICRHGR